jgi:hypothetical protein
MNRSLTVTATAILGLAGLVFTSSTQALPLVPLPQAAPPSIKVGDEGTYIKEEERPNEITQGSQVNGAAGANPKYANPADGDDANAGEVQELQRAFPSTEWPPSMRHD